MTAHRPDTATFSRRDTIRTLGIGAAAVVAAFVVPRRDWFGWVALTVMPTQRLAAWITAWVEGALPGGSPGHPQAAAQVALYALLVAAVFVASSMRPASMDQAAADGGDTTPGST